MYELYPYFTNDGTVGLFSQADDDIYHSTYGALTESWQKFIIPSRLQEFVRQNESVKILDICYGIGYNTKTALSVFVENYFREKKIINKKNKFFRKKVENDFKNLPRLISNIAEIDTDNNLANLKDFSKENICEKKQNFEEINNDNTINNDAIDADNILSKKNKNSEEKICNKILIDAVDTDEILIELSPFIKSKPVSRSLFDLFYAPQFKDCFSNVRNDESTSTQLKTTQIKKIQNRKLNKLKKEFRLRKEVSILIFEKLLEKYNNSFELSKITEQILSDKKNSQFLSKFMLNFASFCQNSRSNNMSEYNKYAFLHNIYYRYVSKSYKNAREVLQNAQVDVNLNKTDARAFLKATDTLYDFIFLDAFTPAKCPALWTIEFFQKLYSKLNDDGMVLTYSNSAAIRNAFLQNGFAVGKTYDKELKKFVGTVAAKNPDLIDYPLNSYDLGLINSKAGICYRDETLELDNSIIIENRNIEAAESDLLSSSQYLKGQKNVKPL